MMNDRDMAPRLTRLRALCIGALLLAATALTAALLPQLRPPSVVRAESFHLVDATGAVHGEFTLQPAGPVFVLKDRESGDRVKLFHEADTTGLYVMDATGATRIGIAQFSHGGGGVALHGPETKGAVVLYLKERGSLRIYDPDGKVAAEFTSPARTDPAGTPGKPAASAAGAGASRTPR